MSSRRDVPPGGKREAYAKAIGKVLRSARTHAGMNMRDLSEKSGLSMHKINRIENAEYEVDLVEFLDLFDAIGISGAVAVRRVQAEMAVS